jgi:hypothetical protein
MPNVHRLLRLSIDKAAEGWQWTSSLADLEQSGGNQAKTKVRVVEWFRGNLRAIGAHAAACWWEGKEIDARVAPGGSQFERRYGKPLRTRDGPDGCRVSIKYIGRADTMAESRTMPLRLHGRQGRFKQGS